VIEQLFGSKTRVKLLQLFYSNPNRSFYVREITRKIDEQINSVRRELANLLSIGIISSDTQNNKLYYEVNQQYEFYEPLSAVFGGSSKMVKPKTASAQPTDVSSIGNVEIALYTGQFTRDESSGVDVLIVGDINPTQLDNFMQSLEQQEGKEIRYTSMTRKEFDYRQTVNDRFLATVLSSKHQVIIDKSGILS
jgi:predicted transcriptional regulator